MTNMINKQDPKTASLIRHLIGFVGGILTAIGVLSATSAEALVGLTDIIVELIIALIGVILQAWAIWVARKAPEKQDIDTIN
jgi:heme/copper-type cytochrome/quinol oxidase subunit 4